MTLEHYGVHFSNYLRIFASITCPILTLLLNLHCMLMLNLYRGCEGCVSLRLCCNSKYVIIIKHLFFIPPCHVRCVLAFLEHKKLHHDDTSILGPRVSGAIFEPRSQREWVEGVFIVDVLRHRYKATLPSLCTP